MGSQGRSVEAYLTMITARRIVALAEQGQWEEKRTSLPQRRVIEMRV